ncbi:MAG: hypothetical protein U9N56_08610 [Actinomycetota bacterium]|nr:hypothetical protein [Actinomycetota bacterium]
MPDLIDHLGAWEGTWLTFLRPDELHDEAPVRATIDRDDDGFVIEYSGSIESEEVSGRLRWSEAGGTTTVDWVDSWHTSGKQERLAGFGDAPPSYQYGGDDPWTWDITIDATDSGVTVTHHNAGPEVPRYMAVLMRLEARSS